MLLISSGAASGYDDQIYNPFNPALDARFVKPVRQRDDLATPLMVLNTEAEALEFFPARQPDTHKFRYWEVAGASHAPTGLLKIFDEKGIRDGFKAQSCTCTAGCAVGWRHPVRQKST